MRYLLTLLFAMTASGQGLLIDPYKLAPSGPPAIASLRYYWVASDLPLGVVSGNWADRVNGYGLGQATAADQPTNTASGVHFDGAPIHLTNSPTGWTWATNGSPTRGSLWIVLTPTTPASFGGILCSSSASGYGTYTTSGSVFRNFMSGGSPTWGAFVSGSQLDVAMVITGTAVNSTSFYTNGVFNSTATAGNFASGTQLYVGRDGSGGGLHYRGYIQEIAFFSDHLTSDQITTLHNYATNRYGFSP